MKRNKTKTVLEELMQRYELSITDISRETGIGATTLRSWLKGTVPRGDWQVAEVAQLFSVSVSYLLFGEEVSPNLYPR